MSAQRHVIRLEEAPEDIGIVGGKALGIIRLVKNKIPTAPGFVITTKTFSEFLRRSGLSRVIEDVIESLENRASPERVSRDLIERVESAEIPSETVREITEAYRDLCLRSVGSERCRVAVRSSAVVEDISSAAFAGQHDTFLNVVGPEDIIRSIKRCWASLFNARALVYRKAKGLISEESLLMAVIVQLMIDSRSSGVTFTVNPLDGDPHIVVIESIWGLGEYVVRGVVTPDKLVIDKKGLKIVEKFISKKDKELVFDPAKGSSSERLVDERRASEQSISDDEAVEIARVAVKLEELVGSPVDIEWAIDGGGRLYILQVRPVTSLPKQQPRVGVTKEKRVFKGLAASPGIAMGRARILREIGEAKTKGFNRGEILVTLMTDPDWVPIMRIASAIVTERGGVTSHAAITARELGIPAVVGVPGILDSLSDGEILKVDGSRGVIEVLESLEAQRAAMDRGSVEVSLAAPAARAEGKGWEELYVPTATKIYMNLGEPEAIERYLRLPFDGIGLMRIEFVISSWVGYHPLYLIKNERQGFFTDRLASGIAMVASKISPRPVVVRFSDFKSNEYKKLIGGEEFEPDERNPMIGWRGASRYIHPLYREAFRLELRAIKKVRDEMGLKNVWVMIPMVRTIWEAERVIELMAEEDLRSSRDFKVWAMAEVPSVALLIDEFSKYFDGFSIGSNDLTQMILGIDRDSDLLSSMGYFDERDEAVIKAMRMIIKGAKRNGRTASICGQAPSYYPEIVEFLVIEGIDSISVNPDAVISTRRMVAGIERKVLLESLSNKKGRKKSVEL